MEEAFFQLYQEFTRLQDLCVKQAELLQKLMVKQEPKTDIPISMPIQCTDDGGLEKAERCSFKKQVSKADNCTLSNPTVLRDLPQDADVLSRFDIKYPLSAANDSQLSSANGKSNFATALLSQDCHKLHVGKKADCDTLLKNYRTFPALEADKETSTAPPRPLVLATLNLEDVGSFPSFLDLYEAPQDLPVDRTSHQMAHIKVPIEIRGPTQTSWTPGWVVEDSPLGHSGDFELQRDPANTDL